MSISIRQHHDGQHVLVCDTQPLPGQAREAWWLPIQGVPHLRWRTTKRTTSEHWRDGACITLTDEQRTTLVFGLEGEATKIVINEVDMVHTRDDNCRASTTYTVEPRVAWHYARALPHDFPLLSDPWIPLWEWSTNAWRIDGRTYQFEAHVNATNKEHDHADL